MEAPENIAQSEIHNFLIRRLGQKEADEIMTYINTEVDKEVAAKVNASKQEIALWRDDMKNVFATKEDAAILEKKLVKRVSAAEGTLILWSFVFWLTLIVAVFCIFKFIK
ncbi:MAG: hypothetical protein M3Z92_10245 [Bacteroidota bacterium]|nr:hypothetical protein [Bacteroidota bacterium]